MNRIHIRKSAQVLLDSTLTNADLWQRLDGCGVPTEWGWAFCRTAGCHRCRVHRVAEWILDATAALACSRVQDLRFVTVMLPPTADIGAVKGCIDRGKVAWRNIVHRLRQDDERAAGVRVVGAAEVDWYYPHHVERLSGYKRAQLDSMGFDKTASNVWMPHFHLVVDLAACPNTNSLTASGENSPEFDRLIFKCSTEATTFP